MTTQELAGIKEACVYLIDTPGRQGCRCGGTCAVCRKRKEMLRRLLPSRILDLVRVIEGAL